MKDVDQIHTHIIQAGLLQTLLVIGKIIVVCAVSERGDMDYAAFIFENIQNPDGVLYNTMIRGFSKK